MARRAKKWMKRAFKNARGQFKAKAKRAGMSTRAYANKVLRKGSKASAKTKRQARLAKTGMKYGGKKGRKKRRRKGKKKRRRRR